MKITFSTSCPPLGGIFIAEYVKITQSAKIELGWGNTTLITVDGQDIACANSNDVGRVIARNLAESQLYGASPIEKTEVDHWLTYTLGPLKSKSDFICALQYLNRVLGPITYFVGKRITIADFIVFAELHGNNQWQDLVAKKEAPNNLLRWFNHIKSLDVVKKTLNSLPNEVKTALQATTNSRQSSERGGANRAQEGKFVDLPGAEMGKVVVRFPPEASGYLHIGHAKAALLNQYYQQAFDGKLIMRFDDTNPAKENVHFEKVILEDVEMLEIKPDLFTHTSQYFDLMLDYCEKLLKDGKAYADDTEPEQMKLQREQKVESANRNNSYEKNMQLWSEMKSGTQLGQKCCIRAKIDMQSPNGCMRDPTIYRCKNEIHPRTGDKYKVYPTYDFACPIVDAIENVTHTLRTMEYHDRDAQFYWFIDALGLRKPYIWEYSRLSMTNTVLSKRKLTWFVENKLVDGWDDPRFPTVRGVLRRGMTVEGLKQFIIAQGSSRSVVFMEWDKIWAFNKKVIDPIAPRYTAVDFESPIPVLLKGVKEEKLQVPRHPKNAEIGNKEVWIGPRILIDLADAETLKEGENSTFINWGNLIINKINRENGKVVSVEATPNLENKDYKKTIKLTWLAETDSASFTPTRCVYFEHIISKALLGKDEDFKQFVGHETKKEVQMLGDPELKKLKKGDIIQLQRRGFFKVDVAYQPLSLHTCKETAIVLFSIPDGHTKENPTAGGPKAANSAKSSAPTKNSTPGKKSASEINEAITKQGDLVRNLKNQKAVKAEIDSAVQGLLALKAEYKSVTNTDWKPGCVPPTAEAPKVVSGGGDCNSQELSSKISAQGDKVRDLKTAKAAKDLIEPEVKTLLSLKADYKKLTGSDWKPGVTPTPAVATPSVQNLDEAGILEKIAQQGDKIRDLKSKKAEKSVVESEVKILLGLKTDYKNLTGSDWKPGAVASSKPAPAPACKGGDETAILEKIAQQGDKIRDLKSKKAEKSVVESEVKILLGLKVEYKNLTGNEWKPGVVVSSKPAAVSAPQGEGEASILAKIAQQGDKIRDLKSKKAEKSVVDSEVKILLGLKTDYKSLTGNDWKPGVVASTKPAAPQQESETSLSEKITKQGEKVRDLKSQKAEKVVIDGEVKVLLSLKADYKNLTGKEWKPVAVSSVKETVTQGNSTDQAALLNNKIGEQGNKIRKLKEEKAEKSVINTEVKTLLALKEEFKKVTGKDWKPGMAPANAQPSSTAVDAKDVLTARVNQQAEVVKNLKAAGAPQADVQNNVKILLDLKAEYKTLTGTDFPSAGRSSSKPAKLKEDKAVKPKEEKNIKKKTADETDSTQSGLKKQTKLGLEATKEEDLPNWYSQVITKGELIEYYDVSGCYILRPWSFSIWEAIRDWFDTEIKKLGVQNCYFPIFVSRAALEKEKSHIADFSPEVAWVTKSGDSDLAEPVAVRPTSETVMYPAYAKWIQSHRDLPIKLNQWNNVVRWEFKHPQPFLRTREFLWQEGHTAYANEKEACEEVTTILDLYAKVYTELLAIPVIKGRKTEKEKFAGGNYTLTIEGFISATGRGIQAATSHHLGQNFSKMFEIVFLDPETQEKSYVYQNSWGITTRTIGVMVMVHADNQGLVLPPRVASIQAIVVPCGMPANFSEADRKELQSVCDALESDLLGAGVRVKGDYRDNYSAGWKFNHWELKGVPIRVEVGPKDVKNKQVVAVRRDTGEKITIKRENVVEEVKQMLNSIQQNLFNKASEDFASHTVQLNDWSQFTPNLNKKNVILAPFCGEMECEDKIKADSTRDASEVAEAGAPSMGAKSLCIPLEQPNLKPNTKCIHPDCKHIAKFYTLFGRSY